MQGQGSIELKHLKSVLQDNSYKQWMFRISPKTGTKLKVKSSPIVLTVSHFATCKEFQKNLQKFSKNKELAHSTSLSDPTPRETRNVEVQCEGCDDFCIGETASPFGTRFKEHVAITRASTTAVGDHLKLSGQTLDMSSFSILAREEDMFKRRVREAIEIFCQAPTLNRDADCEFPAIYRDVLSRDSLCKSRDITRKSNT